MKTFKEIKIIGTKENLQKFSCDILQFEESISWKIGKMTDGFTGCYIQFEYVGKSLDKATAFIRVVDGVESFSVCNIVPKEKGELNYDEYNSLLQSLYDEVLKFFDGKNGIKVEFYGGDIKIENIISEEAKRKLMAFVMLANPSTGSVHPNDKKRWMDFVVQTFDDDCIMDIGLLERFLVEEKKWHKVVATDLVIEYENDIDLLRFYDERKNNLDG